MTLNEIKEAVDNNKVVHWSSVLYQVIKSNNEYLIKCLSNGYMVGLTWRDGKTMNGNEEDFFIPNN